MSKTVVDSSAVLAYVFAEPGRAAAESLMLAGAISAVNLAEVATKIMDRGSSGLDTSTAISELGLELIPFDGELALETGRLREATRSFGLSLGDRACLATARRLKLPAVTADQAWAGLRIPGIKIHVIR